MRGLCPVDGAEAGGFTAPHATALLNRWRSRWQTPVEYLSKVKPEAGRGDWR